jgi:hypothetical protein
MEGWEPREGDRVRVWTYADCDGGGDGPHEAAEDGHNGRVTRVGNGPHGVFVLLVNEGTGLSQGKVSRLERAYAPHELAPHDEQVGGEPRGAWRS